MNRFSLALCLICLAFPSVGVATDWPQFRGPNASGVTSDANAPTSWSANENLLWQTDIPGAGWSSPIVIGDKLFVTTAVTDGPQNSMSDYRWEVLCLDSKTGKVLWTKTALEGKPRLETHRDNTYASETPVSDGKYDERSNWGSAIIWENSHRQELVTGGAVVRSYDPNTGNLLWQVDIGNGGLNATPTASGDLLVVGRSGRGGTSFFAIRSGTDEQLAAARGGDAASLVAWNTRDFGPNRASPLIVDGMIYLLDGRGGKATIVDSATGVLVTQGRIPEAGEFWASPWSNQGRIYCLDASGQTFVLQPGRTLDVVGKNVLPPAENVRFWSTPALADGTLFIRSSKTLYAIGTR